jgi:hypothetical protein
MCAAESEHFDGNLFDALIYTQSDWVNIEFLLRQFILMQLSDILVGMNFFGRRL